MSSIIRLAHFAEESGKAMYIEHNDFLAGGLDIAEEIDDLLENSEVTPLIADRMREQESIWSVRYYHANGHFEIIYDASLERAAHRMMEKLGIA